MKNKKTTTNNILKKKLENNNHIFNPIKRIHRKLFDPARLDKQESIDTQIREKANDNVSYYIFVLISTIIISVGLIIDNTAVVIGGMIIAPVIWPILALAVGTIHGRKRMLRNSIFIVLKTVGFILAISFLIGLVSPIYEFSDEILSRTGPTLFDLIIALAAGFGAAFATIYAHRSATIFGVAIAVALVPPLCVLGVLFASSRMDLIGGALLLFLTNLVAVLISAMIVFALAKFSGPKTKAGEENRKRAILSTAITFIIICVPLAYLTWNAVVLTKVKDLTYETFEKSFINEQISDIEVTKGKYSYVIKAHILSEDDIPYDRLKSFSVTLSNRIKKAVNIDFDIIKTEKQIIFTE